MKTAYPRLAYKKRSGFTLLELIGVLAILSILAVTVAPTALRTIEAASIKAEKESMTSIGKAIREYTRKNGSVPLATLGTPPTWVTQISANVENGTLDIWRNKRQVNRVLLVNGNRAMVLSSMRQGLNLPTQAGTTPVQFDDIWMTRDGDVPTSTNWPAGWTNASVQDAGQYLAIERINLSEYLNTRAISLAVTAGAPSYRLKPKATGVLGPAITTFGTLNQIPGDYIELYRDAAATPAQLAMTYTVVDRDQNFIFDGTVWKSH